MVLVFIEKASHSSIPGATALDQRRQRGMALVLTLGILALMMVLVTALLTQSGTERAGGALVLAQGRAHNLAEVATNLVVSQIRASMKPPVEGQRTSWASQPGAQRQYDDKGDFIAGYRLYSDDEMIVAGQSEQAFASDLPPVNWHTQPLRYTDLNAPLPKPGQKMFYPIFDPALQDATEQGAVDGFSCALPENFAGTNPLPMPVQWLYILADGTLGVLDEAHHFVTPKGGSQPTLANPVTGRIAFWADDECNKLNLNTAGEPTYWAQPNYTHVEDFYWAISPPAAGECQRVPGHPATTALSPVLAPDLRSASHQAAFGHPCSSDDLAVKTERARLKEDLYRLLPRIHAGGSTGGTVWQAEKRAYAVENDAAAPEKWRTALYPVLDDALFSTNATGDLRQKQADLNLSPGLAPNETALSRWHGVLTTGSLAPETTLFGTPRVAMWPVHTDAAKRRTQFDHYLAHCATAGAFLYYFTRQNPLSPGEDAALPDNVRLLQDYLGRLMTLKVPGYGGAFSDPGRYDAKDGLDETLGPEHDQILAEIFDYIRSINPTDPLLAKAGLSYTPANLTSAGVQSVQTGSGSVVPARIDLGRGRVAGLGRFLNLSEMGFLFICCADGNNELGKDETSPRIRNPHLDDLAYISLDRKKCGGAVVRGQTGASNDPVEKPWFSNFPPLSATARANFYAPAPAAYPGYQEENWNKALETDTPLDKNVRRIQAIGLLEFFSPMHSYPLRCLPDRVDVVITGLSGVRVNGQSLFPKDQVVLKRVNNKVVMSGNIVGDVSTVGMAEVNITPSTATRRLFTARPPYPAEAGATAAGTGDKDFDFLSNYLDVTVPDAVKPTMRLQVERPIKVETLQNGQLVQSVELGFPKSLDILIPKLATATASGKSATNDDVDTWGNPTKTGGASEIVPAWYWNFAAAGAFQGVRGRAGISTSFAQFQSGNDTQVSVMPWHGDYRLVAARSFVGQDRAKAASGKSYDNPALAAAEGGAWLFQAHPMMLNMLLENPVTGKAPVRWAGNFRGAGFDGANLTEKYNLTKTRVANSDFPRRRPEVGTLAQRYGDFDSAMGISNQDGALCNAPDEGSMSNFGMTDAISKKTINIAYLKDSSDTPMPPAFFSPNRIVPSAAMMGSLPSGVMAQDPWRTLLFRPDIAANGERHPGSKNPPDHVLLDWFWMPIVTPWPISEPLATAGKVNLNRHLLPFSYIDRKTALYGLLKGEVLTALPNANATVNNEEHKFKLGDGKPFFQALRDKDANKLVTTNAERTWHRKIDLEKTVRGMDIFNKTGPGKGGKLFRSDSQLCEIHLVPADASPAIQPDDLLNGMKSYWSNHVHTGENLRERPYVNLLGRVTTRTNAWTVHYRAQAVKLPRSAYQDPAGMTVTEVKVEAESRGAVALERFVDAADPGLPDFTQAAATLPVEAWSRFRLHTRRRY